MSSGFVHSVKVPRFYKVAAKTVQSVEENGTSLKQLIYEKKHPNLGGLYALATTTLKNASQLAELLRKSKLLLKENRLDPWLARVLIAELLWGKGNIKSESKPVQTILSYEKELRELLKDLDNPALPVVKQVGKPRYVRVNTLVSCVEDIIRSFIDDEWILLPKSPDYSSYLTTLSRLNGSWFVQDFHIPELLVFPPGTKFHEDSRYKAGAIVLQDKASCFPAFLLKPEPGATVLDMCAAPGMKTTHLAAIMKNEGKIYAIEKDKRRYETLCKLVEEANTSCVTTLNADSMTMDAEKCPNVEYILVDPSCSGSGMSDRLILDNGASKSSPRRLQSLQSFQVLLLRHALCNFPMAKRVIYSTCSIFPEENEMVIDEILTDIGNAYKLRSVKKILHGNWKNFSSKDYACKDKCLYAKPEIDYSNGFFLAVFERNFDVPLPEFSRRKVSAKTDREENFDENEEQKNEINDESIDVTNSEEKKKRKKRKRKDSTNSITEKVCEDPIENGKEKKKKKKKKIKLSKVEESQLNGTINDDQAFPSEEESVTKKSKKKKEKLNVEPDSPEIIDPNKSLTIDQGTKKKKRNGKLTIVSDEIIKVFDL